MDIAIKAQHPVYIRNAEEEVQLLKNGLYSEKADYICCHTFKSREAQMLLIDDEPELIELQSYMSKASWHPEVRTILEARGELTPNYYDATDFKKWLHHVLCKSSSDSYDDKMRAIEERALSAAGAKVCSVRSYEDFKKIILDGVPLEIRKLDHELPSELVGPYVQKAPIESVFRYLKNFNIDTADGQKNLLKRQRDALTWQMVSYCSLHPETMQMIEASGNLPLLYAATIRTYGWDVKKSLELGSIRTLQEHLTAEFNKKYGTEMVL